MPAMITHFRLACRVLEQYDHSIDRDCFLLGAQGPDLLFFFRAYPWLRGENGLPLGNALHDARPSLLLDTMTDIVSAAPQEYRRMLNDYVCGFLCHYASDRTFHPFVCSRQQELRKAFPAFGRVDEPYHYRYESALDTWMIHLDYDKPVTWFALCDVIPGAEPTRDKALAFFYHRLLVRVLHKDIPEPLLEKLTSDMRHSMRLMRDRFGIKRTAFRALETVTRRGAWYSALIRTDRIDDFDYLNTSHTPWQWENVTHDADARQLLDEAVALALLLITQYTDGADGYALTHDVDFTGRRYIQKEGHRS